MVGRSKEYQIYDERSVCHTCQRGIFRCCRGRALKKFSLPPLACSRSPPSFHNNSVIDLWLIIFTISHTIRETTSFYPQLRYSHFLCFYMKCCWPPLLDLARQSLFVLFGKLQYFNYLHPLNNHLLNLSLVVTSRYSVPITFPPSDDTCKEIRHQKGIFVREMSGNFQENPSPHLADTLIFYLLSIQCLLPASYGYALLVFKNCYFLCFSTTMLVWNKDVGYI